MKNSHFAQKTRMKAEESHYRPLLINHQEGPKKCIKKTILKNLIIIKVSSTRDQRMESSLI